MREEDLRASRPRYCPNCSATIRRTSTNPAVLADEAQRKIGSLEAALVNFADLVEMRGDDADEAELRSAREAKDFLASALRELHEKNEHEWARNQELERILRGISLQAARHKEYLDDRVYLLRDLEVIEKRANDAVSDPDGRSVLEFVRRSRKAEAEVARLREENERLRSGGRTLADAMADPSLHAECREENERLEGALREKDEALQVVVDDIGGRVHSYGAMNAVAKCRAALRGSPAPEARRAQPMEEE